MLNNVTNFNIVALCRMMEKKRLMHAIYNEHFIYANLSLFSYCNFKAIDCIPLHLATPRK